MKSKAQYVRVTLRIARGLGILALVGLITGAVWERWSEVRDAARYPPAGKLFDVGDGRLHVNCQGPVDVGPTIVLEMGLGGFSSAWGEMFTKLRSTMRTCAYDRPGTGWSDLGREPHDAEHIEKKLARAMHASGEHKPYVLVGASIGGLYIREYVHLFPEDVAGMVFIDPSHEDQLAVLPKEEGDKDRGEPDIWPEVRATLGITRWLMRHELASADSQTASMFSRLVRPGYWRSKRLEMEERLKSEAEVRATGKVGDIPIVILSAGSGASKEFIAARQGLHRRMLELSAHSR